MEGLGFYVCVSVGGWSRVRRDLGRDLAFVGVGRVRVQLPSVQPSVAGVERAA